MSVLTFIGQVKLVSVGTHKLLILPIFMDTSHNHHGLLQYNRLSNLGQEGRTAETHLVGTEVRLALNPRVQLISFLQYNTASERTTLNSRFVWEYRPLSYIYLVYNDNRQELPNAAADIITRTNNQQGIFKATYLRQF